MTCVAAGMFHGCGEPGFEPPIDGPIVDAAIDPRGADRPDEVSGPQLHAIYAIPVDGEDRQLDLDGSITRSVNAFNAWLAAKTGGPALRLDLADGTLDVSFVRMPRTAAAYTAEGIQLRNTLELDLTAVGAIDPSKLYAVYYDGANMLTCGGGAYPPELIGRVGALYLTSQIPGAPPCDSIPLGGVTAPQYPEFAMLHELMHTLGVVAPCAPNHTMRGHTSDSASDLMYGGPEPWRPAVLDVGADDYYGHGRTDCLDMARSAFLDPMPANAELPPGW